METYNARIAYVDTNDHVCSFNSEGFYTVKDATEYIVEKIGWFMLNWAEVNPNGLIVSAEVFNDDDTFSDLYELRCGM